MNSLEKIYSKLISNIPIVKNTNPDEWTISNSLSYIAYKYKEKFDQSFVFTYDNIPSKCIEYKMTSRVWLMLGAKAGNGAMVKNYVDWFYENYKGKRRFRSIGAMAKVTLISEYNELKSKPIEVKTANILDGSIQAILQQLEDSAYIKTYGDLYFFVENLKIDEELNSKFNKVKNNMIKAGFDFDILNRIS